MKKIFLIFLLIGSLVTAQTIDTLNFASTDSVDIRAIVQKQIDAAKAKIIDDVVDSRLMTEAKIDVPVVKNTPVQASSNTILSLFMNQPVHYMIYEIASLIIIGFVLLRRTFKNFGKSSTKNLKVKIGMMREEKIGGAKVNPKMLKIRKVLKDNLDIFRQNDQQLAKTARQLNVSQGELLLAARLKFFEMKKM